MHKYAEYAEHAKLQNMQNMQNMQSCFKKSTPGSVVPFAMFILQQVFCSAIGCFAFNVNMHMCKMLHNVNINFSVLV